MLKSQWGHPVNVASVASVTSWPDIDPFTVFQNAVLGVPAVLREELVSGRAPIGVSAVHPGILARSNHSICAVSPREVAQKVLDAIRHNRPYVYTDEYGAAVLAHFEEILDECSVARSV
jgi:short-subunit dehydrogenase